MKFRKKMLAALVLGAMTAVPALAEDTAKPAEINMGTWDAELGLQYRRFSQAADVPAGAPAQDMDTASLSLLARYRMEFNGGKDSFVFSPFMRYDSMDEARSHVDIRELLWTWQRDDVTWRAGVGKVFWGTSEANHLVDVVNQTDTVEDIKGEDKLGQPMLRATVRKDWGTLDMFVMTGFRERTLPSSQGRPGSGLALQDIPVVYENSDGNMHPEFAIRWSKTTGNLDVGVSGFIGNNRMPQLISATGIPLLGITPSALPIPVNLDAIQALFQSLTPAQQAIVQQQITTNSSLYYSEMSQLGIDASYLWGDMTFKLEAVHRDIGNDSYTAGVVGVEKTISEVFNKPWDLTLFAEYNTDSRGNNGQAFLQNDLFLGSRLALNDSASTEVRLGGFFDVTNSSQSVRFEASRRLTDQWKVRFIGQTFRVQDQNDPFYMYHDDSYAQFDVIRYF